MNEQEYRETKGLTVTRHIGIGRKYIIYLDFRTGKDKGGWEILQTRVTGHVGFEKCKIWCPK